jgi:ADP-ribose pyrophosphatase YjhB (NUDIX family)
MRRQSQEYPRGTRLQGLVVRDDCLLVVHRFNDGKEYYVLPGGGWEEGETEEEGVLREVAEETSISVQVERLLFSLDIKGDSRQRIYSCRYLDGEPELGDYNERAVMQEGEDLYFPKWLPIEELHGEVPLYPVRFRDWLLEYCSGGQLEMASYEGEISLEEYRADMSKRRENNRTRLKTTTKQISQ